MKKLKLIIPTVGFLSGFSFYSQSAFAYDGAGAASYADAHAKSYNTIYPSYSQDCTNFVSQAMSLGGGLPQKATGTGTYTTSSNYYWYFYAYSGGGHSYSWTVAKDLWDFLLNKTNYAHIESKYNGYIGNHMYNTLIKGDLVAYNWGSHDLGVANHWGMEAGYGTDPSSGWVGDYVDTHTSNRYHAYWTLQPYNSDPYSTTIWTVAIDK